MHTPAALRESANPIVWMRAALMDLGFAGLIEEIEKRFGRAVTTIVIGVLLFGIVVWVFKVVLTIEIEIKAMMASGEALNVILAIGFKVLILALMLAAALGYLRLVFRKTEQRIEKARRESEEKTEKARRELAEAALETISHLQRQMADHKASREDLLALMEKVNAALPDKSRDG